MLEKTIKDLNWLKNLKVFDKLHTRLWKNSEILQDY